MWQGARRTGYSVLSTIVIAGFATCASAQEVPLHGESVVRFATVKEGAAVLGREDRYTKALSRFDLQSRLQTDKEVTSADLRKFAAKPAFSAHGEYWYNLHLAIVNAERWMEIRHEVLRDLLDMVQKAASKHAHRLSRVGLLADHLHLTLGCPIDRSPAEIALGYLNNCAYACGMKPVFRMSYYVGTIGEHDRGAV